MLLRLSWALTLALPCGAGDVAGFPRLPGLAQVCMTPFGCNFPEFIGTMAS
jgi:hypothetical protein